MTPKVLEQLLTSFPGAVKHVERTFDPFPVLEVEEGVRDGLGVTTFEDVFRWQDD